MVESKGKSRVQIKCPDCGCTFLPSLKEKQSRAGKSSRRKGLNFERKVAKDLTIWWSGNYDFKRTPQSGGSNLKEGFDMAGDICTNAPNFLWHIEIKNAPGSFTGLHNFFSLKSKIWQWLEQATKECPTNKHSMLIFNRFDLPTFCAAFHNTSTRILSRLDIGSIPHFIWCNKLIKIAIWQYKDMLNSNVEFWQ